MTISKDLSLSILSMDAYNRGYNPGIANLSDAGGTGLGIATILNVPLPQGSQVADFYALAYTIGAGVDEIALGTTVISFRATDEIQSEIAGR